MVRAQWATATSAKVASSPITHSVMEKEVIDVRTCNFRENEALWREVASLRQKHHKQQQIVNKVKFVVEFNLKNG